jgi:hypothetical protein
MSQEIILAPEFFYGVMNHQTHRPQHIIGGHKSIRFAENFQVFQRDNQHDPGKSMQTFRYAFIHQGPIRKTGDRVRQGILLGPAQSISDAQSEFLHIKRFRNIVICAQFETL